MKQAIKKLAMWLAVTMAPDDSGKVIYYHDVGRAHTEMGTPLELFKAHIGFAKSAGYSFVPRLPDACLNRRLLHVVFDDGFRGIWDARDFIVQEGLRPTVSLAVDLIGRPGYLTWQEILELKSVGFSFQSHTWSHRSLTDVPKDELEHELRDSRVELTEHLQCEVTKLCFPRGLFTQSIVHRAMLAGYDELFSCIPGSSCRSIQNLIQEQKVRLTPRLLVQGATVSEYALMLKGCMNPWVKHYAGRQLLEEVA